MPGGIGRITPAGGSLAAEAFAARKGSSGAVGLPLDLDDPGHKYNRKTVVASMKRQGLVAKAGRKFKAATDSEHSLPVAPNRPGQDFSAEAPNQKWVCDITYLWTSEGWRCLAVVLDLCSRMVVGCAMNKRMKAGLVCDALQMALWRRRMHRGVMAHSDHGNRTRRHSANGYISPLAFENTMIA